MSLAFILHWGHLIEHHSGGGGREGGRGGRGGRGYRSTRRSWIFLLSSPWYHQKRNLGIWVNQKRRNILNWVLIFCLFCDQVTRLSRMSWKCSTFVPFPHRQTCSHISTQTATRNCQRRKYQRTWRPKHKLTVCQYTTRDGKNITRAWWLISLSKKILMKTGLFLMMNLAARRWCTMMNFRPVRELSSRVLARANTADCTAWTECLHSQHNHVVSYPPETQS